MLRLLSPPLMLTAFICCLLLTTISSAKEDAPDAPLKIGIKPSEPWVMYDKLLPESERQPIGFSIDLWNKLAESLGVKTEWVYHDTTPAVINSAYESKVDLGIAAITVSSEREKRVDFSNSMYETGLQIMVSAENNETNPLNILLIELKKIINIKSTGLAIGYADYYHTYSFISR